MRRATSRREPGFDGRPRGRRGGPLWPLCGARSAASRRAAAIASFIRAKHFADAAKELRRVRPVLAVAARLTPP
ncbi:MAG: hypothetical protein DMF98_10960 [Acidobacteria bacterium]|nr:MAG: hypothetical protein DMF98_10960 [Acidobacteriota bacterium]